MNRNRSPHTVSKQSSISSISSHVPLMMTAKNSETYLLTQSVINTTATADPPTPLKSLAMNSPREIKRALTVCQPKGTVPYTVGDNDTIEKVALRFNSTPSELRQLNKLNTRTIFPGQILFVPDERPLDSYERKRSTTSPPPPPPPPPPRSEDGDGFIPLTDRHLSSENLSSHDQSQQDVGSMVWSMARQTLTQPGRAQRTKSDTSTESEPSARMIKERSLTQSEDNTKQEKTIQKSLSVDEDQQLDEDCLQRFIKVNVRLMTEDRQSVAGTLLVTPNALMFDPDVLDPLIKEHGIDKYGLIIKMDMLAGIALYEDSAGYEHEPTNCDEEKCQMHHSTSVNNSHHSQTDTPSKTDEEQIHDLMISLLDQIDKELNPSNCTDTSMLSNASSTLQHDISKNSLDNKNSDGDTFLPIPRNDSVLDDSLPLSNDSDQQPDGSKHSSELLHNDENPVTSQGYYLKNCVPVDEFNKRLGEIDKLLQKQQENYSTPHQIETPYYLCIKTSMHIHDIPSLHPKQYKKPSEKKTDNVYGEKQLEYEYWFSIPKEKVDHLYSFFLLWKPERESVPSIDDDDDNPTLPIDELKLNDKSLNKGFVLLATDDPELSDDHLLTKLLKNQRKEKDKQKEIHYLKRQNTLAKEWEIISVDEIYRRINAAHSNSTHHYNDGIPPPTLLQPSTLINEEQSKQILLELPARVHGLNWCMTFSTENHGFSLNQLYRRSVALDHDSPALLIIKDVEQNIFGAFVPHHLRMSEGFYGTGESFLFTYYPEFRVFNWSGFNEFFVKGDLNSLGFGSGEGTYGLWIDADLYHGRTCPSKTYNNELLTTNEDFIIASVEVWTFID